MILMDYVSVAWQWIFPALGNSALQTTCHNINIDIREIGWGVMDCIHLAQDRE
jgi:hypothetical protein